MSWNLFEKIINAIKPSIKPNQETDVSDQTQQWPEGNSESSQSWPESNTEQSAASQEPSPSYQETTNTPKKDDWQQE